MIRQVDGCKGCGMSPCYHCVSYELECDCCGADELDELYWLDDEQVCKECFIAGCLENAEKVKIE